MQEISRPHTFNSALMGTDCPQRIFTREEDESRRLAAIGAARERVASVGQWAPWQSLGRRFGVACVALEITQRCNLDCSFCYLSTSSQALHDLPLAEIYRRIDVIRETYGSGVDVQITGGEPTLRSVSDLDAVVRYIVAAGLSATLMTNGIRASRKLLRRLAAAGLSDVAFHVDLTQGRKGYASEASLNAVRREYIARAHGLGLAVMFNTTLDERNHAELASMVRFFLRHASGVRFASFQLGAAAGRGVGKAPRNFGLDEIEATIRATTDTPLRFDAVGSGHRACNRYACALVVNGRAYDAFDDVALTQSVLQATAHRALDRRRPVHALLALVGSTLARPCLWVPALSWLLRKLWLARRDLFLARGRVHKLSFFVHAFMASDCLDEARLTACSFMVMTPQGPLSMCAHNAQRDEHLLVAAPVRRGQRLLYWDPSTGSLSEQQPSHIGVELTRRNARGVARQRISG